MLCCDIHGSLAPNVAIAANFHWRRGNILGITGPSGVGKTTLLYHLAGLEKPDTGRITWRQQTWFDAHTHTWIAPHLRPVTLVFQDQRLFPHLDVAGNLHLASRFAGYRHGDRQHTLIQALNLHPLLHQHPAQLSGGQRSRAALARGLLAARDLVLLDEPYAGLDHAARQTVMHATRDYLRKESIAAVLVSHDAEELASLCDNILPMSSAHTGSVQAALDWLNQIHAAGDTRITAILPATSTHFSSADGLAVYQVDGHEILVAADHAPPAQTARLSIAAHDVSLLLDRPAATSIANCLPITVTDWQPHERGVLLALALGAFNLRCQITQRSFQRLAIQRGKSLFAQFKANAVRVL